MLPGFVQTGDMESDSPTTCLVLAAQDGDRAALERLFRRYLPKVRQIVALRLGHTLRDFASYEDLVQEALLNIFTKIDRFHPRSEGKFRYWLSRCVTNSVRTHFRRSRAKKRERLLPFFPYASDGILESIPGCAGCSPQELLEGEELAERIERALLGMKELQREVIILDRVCGMTPFEIRLALGFTTEEGVRKCLSRALRRLRELVFNA